MSTAALSNSADIDVGLITTAPAWDGLEADWRELFAASPSASFPLRWDWLREWWRTYATTYAARDGLRILTARRGGRLIAALPLYLAQSDRFLGVRRLRFLSTGEREFEETCPDYLDLLYAAGEGERCAHALLRRLAASELARTWDALDLTAVRQQSPLLRHAEWRPGESVITPLGACPIADLTGGFDAYYERLSNSRRALSRRLVRVAERAGARFEMACDVGTADRFFNDLVALHQARWTAAEKPGCFAAPRFTAFLHALVVRGAADGSSLIARLALADRPVAVVCGFRTGTKFDFYQSGIDRSMPASTIESPGLTIQFYLMRRLAAEGVTTYDFLRGTTAYKQRLTTDTAALCAMRVTRANVRTTLAHAASHGARAVRGVAKSGVRLLGWSSPAPEAAHS